jgi:hypothetical protein
VENRVFKNVCVCVCVCVFVLTMLLCLSLYHFVFVAFCLCSILSLQHFVFAAFCLCNIVIAAFVFTAVCVRGCVWCFGICICVCVCVCVCFACVFFSPGFCFSDLLLFLLSFVCCLFCVYVVCLSLHYFGFCRRLKGKDPAVSFTGSVRWTRLRVMVDLQGTAQEV